MRVVHDLHIACEVGEAIPYLVKCISKDRIVIGSDSGHNNPSAEEKLIDSLGVKEDVPEALPQKVSMITHGYSTGWGTNTSPAQMPIQETAYALT
jgi:hypothetical protein